MISKRYLGNIITDTPTEPTENFQDSAASGVWSLAEAERYTAAGVWPTQGNVNPVAFVVTGRDSGSTRIRDVDRFNITTLGNASYDGEVGGSEYNSAACSDAVKAFVAGGTSGNYIVTKNYASGSTSADFGDLTVARNELGGYSNSTRGIFGGAAGGFYGIGTIDYITMASASNAIDFGDFSAANRNQQCEAGGSTTRAIYAGFESDKKKSDYITPSTTGNGTNYGDLTYDHNNAFVASNLTRLIVAASYTGGDRIEYNTISSTGSFSDFGTCTNGGWGAAVANSTRCVFAGGNQSGTAKNTIEYITIASTGNTTDFGDLVAIKRACNGAAPSTPSVTG